MAVLNLIVGILSLILGRRLFWIFVAGVGFFGASILAVTTLQFTSEWLIILTSIAAGLAGALLAVFIQHLATVIAGFVGGGYVLLYLLALFGYSGGTNWILFAIGGVIGAALVGFIFEWALILLSSLTGTAMIMIAIRTSIHIPSPGNLFVFAGIFLIGATIQTAWLMQERDRKRSMRG